jgi:hypothetical protein
MSAARHVRRDLQGIGSALAALGLGGQMLASAILALPLLVLPTTPTQAAYSISTVTRAITFNPANIGKATSLSMPFHYDCSDTISQQYYCAAEYSGTSSRANIILGRSISAASLAFSTDIKAHDQYLVSYVTFPNTSNFAKFYYAAANGTVDSGIHCGFTATTATGRSGGVAGSGSARTLTMHAAIRAGTALPTTLGTYSDTLLVTVAC